MERSYAWVLNSQNLLKLLPQLLPWNHLRECQVQICLYDTQRHDRSYSFQPNP